MSGALAIDTADLVKLAIAFLVGAAVGAEREFHDKDAGMRTIILISVGACLFTIFSVRIAGDKDPGRIAAQIVSGIGFLGAGVIIQQGQRVRGLTTAATIWLAAALGIGAGVGYLLFTGLAAGLALVVLWWLPRLERQVEKARSFREYRVTLPLQPELVDQLLPVFHGFNLRARRQKTTKRADSIVCVYQVSGKPQDHDRAVAALMTNPQVIEFEF